MIKHKYIKVYIQCLGVVTRFKVKKRFLFFYLTIHSTDHYNKHMSYVHEHKLQDYPLIRKEWIL